MIQGIETGDTNPCTPSGGNELFAAGDYDIVFSVILGGETVPEKSAVVTATVDGNIVVSAPAYSEWRGANPAFSPGTITVTATGITGHQNDGYVLVVMATLPSQPHAALGSFCQGISSDPFALPDTVLQGLEAVDTNPCAPSGGDESFAGGDYDVSFSVILGGSMTPERSVTVPAVVDGDIAISAPDYATWD